MRLLQFECVGTFDDERRKAIHIKGNQIKEELRLKAIELLCWNDKKGCYADEDSINEFGAALTLAEVIHIINQLETEVDLKNEY